MSSLLFYFWKSAFFHSGILRKVNVISYLRCSLIMRSLSKFTSQSSFVQSCFCEDSSIIAFRFWDFFSEKNVKNHSLFFHYLIGINFYVIEILLKSKHVWNGICYPGSGEFILKFVSYSIIVWFTPSNIPKNQIYFA